MLKLAIVTAAAAVALSALAAVPASADSYRIGDPNVPPGDHGPADTPGGSEGGGGRTFDAGTHSCTNTLGAFPRVYPADIDGVTNGYRVWVTEVCTDGDLLQNEGNAAYLRPTIEQNPVIVAALNDRSFATGDVYAVKLMGNDTINLYVHHFTR